jgi:hypothetical protein
MYKEMKKIQTGNRSLINPFQLTAYQKASISQQSSVYCWSRKQRQISGFCRFIIFWGIKNVRVGGKILGSIGNTHIFSLALLTTIGEGCCDGMVGGFTSTYTIITYSLWCLWDWLPPLMRCNQCNLNFLHWWGVINVTLTSTIDEV